MTLVFERESSGPGTHALIVASGEIPRYPAKGSMAPLNAARELADWLTGHFRNDTAPLASVDMLASSPGRSDFARAQELHVLDPPRSGTFDAALRAWRERLDSDPGNIAVFYYAGYVLRPGETLLAPHDLADYAGGGGGPISFASLTRFMRGCQADRQLFLVDGLVLDFGSATEKMKPLSFAAPAKPRSPRCLVIDGESQEEAVGSVMPLAPALLRILESAAGRPVSARDLAGRLPKLVEPGTRLVRVNVAGDFDFHFTSELAERRAEPDPAVPAPSETPSDRRDGSRKRAVRRGGERERARPPPPASKKVPAIGRDDPEPGLGRLDTLVEAVTRYRAALSAYTPDGEPGQWVGAVVNLGNALLALGEAQQERDPVEEAVASYRLALDACPRDRLPLEWAAIQNALGDALFALATLQPGTEALEEALACYQLALEFFARDRYPSEWASLQSKIGNILRTLDHRRAQGGAPDRPATSADPAASPAVEGEGEGEGDTLQDEANTEFILDDAEAEHDALGRSVLAIGLARRLHKIWRQTNEAAPARPAEESRAAFVVHLDAPWGGGKTSFANFLARVLNPSPPGAAVAAFLAERYPGADLGGLFLDDPPPDAAAAAALARLPADARRPWLVVTFNAWQAEHCAPPWWVFYQAIRKECFRAIRTEGDLAWVPRPPRDRPQWQAALAARWRGLRTAAQGRARWLFLVGREYLWRFGNPKILSVVLLAAIGSIVLVILRQMNVLDGNQLKTWLPILSGALAGLWGLAAFFTESVAPGTASVAERLSLGSGDPFARFRHHFARMMERVRRPVMVVVDDLDRCRPDFIVDLVRGIQTLLRSPRVVFLILGDRDWIERAFETHHEAMKELDVGPEQSFGARFVEKAIQLSFILPALHKGGRNQYIRRVLLGERAGRWDGEAEQQETAVPAPAPPPEPAPSPAPAADEAEPEVAAAAEAPAEAPEPPEAAAEDLAEAATWAAAAVREIVNREAAGRGIARFDADAIVRQVREELAYRWIMGDVAWPAGASEAVQAEIVYQWLALIDGTAPLEQMVSEALAIRAASDDRVEREVTHELQRLAAGFPANPRQIKRIVNAITIYYSVALQRPGVTPDAGFRGRLALWIIIMTEWPRTWRLLASFPGLADMLAGEKVAEALKPRGSARAIRQALETIRADSELTALITGVAADGKRSHARLDSASIETLAQLTPLYSRRLRLDEEKAEQAPAPPARTRAGGAAPKGAGSAR